MKYRTHIISTWYLRLFLRIFLALNRQKVRMPSLGLKNSILIQKKKKRECITTPSFRGSTLNLPPQAAAMWTPWLRIGDLRITGFALRWVPLCLQLGLSCPAPVTALWSFHNGLRPIFGLFCATAPPSSSLLLQKCLSFLVLKTSCWRFPSRSRFKKRVRRCSVVARNLHAQCQLCG